MQYLEKALSFMKFLHEFQNVERIIPVLGKKRLENDAEHSYTFAMLAWYLVETCNFDLNASEVLKLALVHDLVETYAGDTYIYETNEQRVSSKAQREQEAQKKIQAEFPDFKNLHEYIERYEKHNDPESKFVFALDKIVPVLTLYLNDRGDGTFWKEHNVTLAMLKEKKEGHRTLSPEAQKLWDELMPILEKEEKNLFIT